MKLKRKIKKNKKLYNFLLWIQAIIRSFYYSLFLLFFRIFPINNKKIVITSYRGKGYGDMGKYIVEEKLSRKEQNCVIYWASKEQYKNTLPSSVKYVKYNSILYLYHLATAKVWINNARFHLGIIKRKNQYYIQTWHGGLGLKKIEAAATDLPSSYIYSAKKDSKMINLLISNSKYRTEQYKANFWYSGEIAEYGLPRNDIFFKKDKNIIQKVKKELNISKEENIIMYVPTFRSYDFDYLSINFDNLVNKLKNKYGKNYKVLVRLHPNKCDFDINGENIINVTNYPDADELLLITDILISDYSSIFFDFLFTGKNVYLYAPDYKKYTHNRGLNFEYLKLPFSISLTNKELINNIINDEAKKYENDLKNFLKKVNIYDDGTASKKIVDKINEQLN